MPIGRIKNKTAISTTRKVWSWFIVSRNLTAAIRRLKSAVDECYSIVNPLVEWSLFSGYGNLKSVLKLCELAFVFQTLDCRPRICRRLPANVCRYLLRAARQEGGIETKPRVKTLSLSFRRRAQRRQEGSAFSRPCSYSPRPWWLKCFAFPCDPVCPQWRKVPGSVLHGPKASRRSFSRVPVSYLRSPPHTP